MQTGGSSAHGANRCCWRSIAPSRVPAALAGAEHLVSRRPIGSRLRRRQVGRSLGAVHRRRQLLADGPASADPAHDHSPTGCRTACGSQSLARLRRAVQPALRARAHAPLAGVLLLLRPVGGGPAGLQRPDITRQRRRLRAAVDRLRHGGLRWCGDADQALAPLAAEHCLADDRGALGSAAVPPVFHPTAPASDAVPRYGWGILGALYADGNHPAAAARPGRDTRPGLRRAAFPGGSGGAAGSRVRWRAAAISLGAAGDRYLWPRLHPRRAGWPRLTVTASVATRKPLVFRQGMNTDSEIWATWMGSFPSIRVHLRSSVAKNKY